VIRPVDPDRDAAGCVEILQQINPYTTIKVEGWLQQWHATPERARHAQWVAVENDAVVGSTFASLKWFSSVHSAFAFVAVRESHRRRGIATELWERAEHHLCELAPEHVSTLYTQNPAGDGFARAHGFAEARAETLSALDPRRLEAPASRGDVVPLRDVDPREVYDVDMATTPDVPTTDVVDVMPYDEWLDTIWRRPAVTLDGSFGALVDARLAAFTVLATNLDLRRAFTEYTATLREYRGRGLAEAVKRASLAWAAAQGVTAVWTTNDETNAAMLALNAKLGYEPSARRVEAVREARAPAS
jgi:GNAT superfamily N-acetyltransferase